MHRDDLLDALIPIVVLVLVAVVLIFVVPGLR